MIDLHCHLLPQIDDGSGSLATTLEMARIATGDGIQKIYCTPHIYPGLYENTGPDIIRRVKQLQLILQNEGIDLELSYGADTHLVPDVLARVRSGAIPTLGGSRYMLLEPSHHVCPPRFKESVFELIGAGYIPIITHPERLTWVADHYADFVTLARSGAWMQVTGGALLGSFGKAAKQFAEKFIGDGWTAVLASEAHTTSRQAPVLANAAPRNWLGRSRLPAWFANGLVWSVATSARMPRRLLWRCCSRNPQMRAKYRVGSRDFFADHP
jgi:protein-tyrosine phosphatase